MITLYTTEILLGLGYILGSVPFGLVLCFVCGYGDIRKIGSGNIGATNVLRTGNKVLAILTVILDSGKGAAAVCLSLYITNDVVLSAWVGVASVMGHNFPVWLKFKGGKGFATTLGTILAIAPIAGLAMVIIWAVSSKLFKISSLSALIALFFVPVIIMAIGDSAALYPVLSISAIGYIRHWENIKRLYKGTEPKIGQK